MAAITARVVGTIARKTVSATRMQMEVQKVLNFHLP